MSEKPRRIAVTGASGYIGTVLIRRLAERDDVSDVLAVDVREPRQDLGTKVSFVRQDVSEPFPGLFAENEVDTVVHLAYLLRQGRNREANRRVNVGGTGTPSMHVARVGSGGLSISAARASTELTPTILMC